jgi:regulator of RNase E activity RraA
MTVVVEQKPVDALSEAEAERWRHVPVAIAIDVTNAACQIDPAVRPLRPPGEQPRLFGRALTACCEPPDFGAILHAIDIAGPGDVLVIAASGHRDTAMIGEILGGHLRSLGCRGIVCDGAVRDVKELSSWDDFSVFTRYVNPRGPTAVSLGTVNGEVMIGNMQVAAGDLVLGDDDGVAILSPALARSTIAAAEAKMAKEREWIEGLASSKTAVEVFGLDLPLRR